MSLQIPPLLRLPAEIRNDIFSLALIEPEPISIETHRRHLRDETLPIYYGCNTFPFDYGCNFYDLRTPLWLSLRGQGCAEHMRRVIIMHTAYHEATKVLHRFFPSQLKLEISLSDDGELSLLSSGRLLMVRIGAICTCDLREELQRHGLGDIEGGAPGRGVLSAAAYFESRKLRGWIEMLRTCKAACTACGKERVELAKVRRYVSATTRQAEAFKRWTHGDANAGAEE
ncbi:hypothetical protein LTR17_014786 [Elasticomyces elasticus]|nr:hypothetical protein LTR17_014786 [Elasticomyces elasticus]